MLRRLGGAVALVSVFGISLACSHAPRAPENAVSPIAIDAGLGNKFVKAGASQPMVARINLSTERKTSNKRPPVNVALVVDTSGSMEGKAIENARAASLAFLDSLAKEDRLSVVVFHSKAETLLPSTRIADADLTELRRKIGAMKAQGTTDMGQGLRLAMNEVEQNLVTDGVNRVVMLGDGVPNDAHPIDGLVAEATTRGISVTTLGLGDDYDEILMGRIAQQTGGKFDFVEDSSKVASFFKEEVVRLHQVVARSAWVELKPGPGVVVSNVVGRPMTRRDRSVQVFLGDLSLGEKHELVVELAGNPAKDGAAVEVMDVEVHWREGTGGAEHEDRVFLGARSTADAAKLTSGADPSVSDAFARAKDAATTLERLEQERKKANLSPHSKDEEEDKRVGGGSGGGSGGGPGAAPAALDRAPAPRPSPMTVRRTHNEAIQNFQARH